MPELPHDPLAIECAAWCRYLAGVEPSPALAARYRDAHAQGFVAGGAPGEATDVATGGAKSVAFDRALVRLARAGRFAARACDVHARVFRPAGLLRRKLVLTHALLETDAATCERVDRVDPGSRAGLFALLAAWSLRFALLLAAGLVVFLPLRLACAFVPSRERRA